MKKLTCALIFFSLFWSSATFSISHSLGGGKQEKGVQVLTSVSKGEGPQPSEMKVKSFDEIVNDSTKMEGLFTLYLKEDKLYLEILPDQCGRMYLMIPTLWTSVENGGAGSYLPLRVFVWEKMEKKVLLVWKNATVVAEKSQEYKRALKNVVPDSIVCSFKIESAPHPVRKSILICLDDCFFSDLQTLSSFFGDPSHPYSVDKARTVWGKALAFPKNIELEVRYTLASSRPRPMATVPDPSVITMNVRYSISELPTNNGYKPRLADDRVGYFLTKVYNYDKLDLDGTLAYYVNRWNLEKREPKEKVSEPKEPIVFWLENTIPVEYRKPIRDGILEWNKAFEKIGFKNAMVVKEMPDNALWDPADIRYNTIRWIPSLTGGGEAPWAPLV